MTSAQQLVDPSALPVRERGLRTRAGNAMSRTRASLLDGAVRAVEKYGARRTTMADIASLAGVAKGTLYNHFRTKDAVYAAALDTGIRALAEECGAVAPDDLGEALALAADRLASHPALQRIASDEPAVFASFARLGVGGAWPTARAAVHEVLTAAGCEPSDASVELVLRWLVSFAGANGTDIRAQAAAVAAGIEHTKVTAVRS